MQRLVPIAPYNHFSTNMRQHKKVKKRPDVNVHERTRHSSKTLALYSAFVSAPFLDHNSNPWLFVYSAKASNGELERHFREDILQNDFEGFNHKEAQVEILPIRGVSNYKNNKEYEILVGTSVE